MYDLYKILVQQLAYFTTQTYLGMNFSLKFIFDGPILM
jgi:hypothetical protein